MTGDKLEKARIAAINDLKKLADKGENVAKYIKLLEEFPEIRKQLKRLDPNEIMGWGAKD